MQTILRGIAEKSARQTTHRFQNLINLLTVGFLISCFKYLNKNSAPGVDGVDPKRYGLNLKQNVEDLVERLKRGRYRAKFILRRFIPKSGGKLRPLGIPVIEDKLLQTAVTKILAAIFEPIFLACSFGYRPKVGALDAVKDLSRSLQFNGYHHIVEADIRGFFDNIRHDKLMEMLSEKIDDKPFLRLIRKWLKAGVLEKGMVIDPITGTPQGGIISPMLANIYLHYALDAWFEEVVKKYCRGRAYLCRYADDFVCAFQFQDDAERFYAELELRLEEFGLSLATEKTRIVRFSSFHLKDKSSFDFLGFEFRWSLSRKLKPQVKRRTSRKNLRESRKKVDEWCRKSRRMKMSLVLRKFKEKLRGYYNYYGVIGNFKSLAALYYYAVRSLFKWMNRRSQRKSYSWKGFIELLKIYENPRPRIMEQRPMPRLRFQWRQSV